MERLKDRVALVLGAGSVGPGWGNGKASAVAYAREGAIAICIDVRLAAAEETVGIIGAKAGAPRPMPVMSPAAPRSRRSSQAFSRVTAVSISFITTSAPRRWAARLI